VRPFLGRFYFYAQSLQTISKGCCLWNSFTFGLFAHVKKRFTCISLYKPMWGLFGTDFNFMRKLYKPCPMKAVCQISEYMYWTTSSWEEYLLKFTKFYPFGAPIGASPLIFANLHPHSPKMLPTKFGSNQFSDFGEEVV